MAEIGNRIRETRKQKHLTQQDLSEKLNVSRSAVANWEVGRNYPDLDSIVRLSDILDLSLDQLLREDIIMVKKVSGEQRKNDIRKKILTILFPMFVLLLCFIGYLLYQEDSRVHQFFSPEISATITINEQEENQWKQLKFQENAYLYLSGLFWKKEVINDANSQHDVSIAIFKKDGVTMIDEFLVKVGESKEINAIANNSNYIIQVKAKTGTYQLNFI